MASAALQTFQQLGSSCGSLIFEFQDGIYYSLRGRFAERRDTVVLDNGKLSLLPSFRQLEGAPDRLLDLDLLALNRSYSDPRFPLHLAIFEGELNVIKQIVACREGLLTVDMLVCAIQNDQLEICEFLLPYALHDESDKQDMRFLLDVAVRSNSLASLKYLYNHGFGRWSLSAMESAVEHGNLEMITFMHMVDPTNCEPVTILEVAVDQGFTEVVKFILENIPVNSNRYVLFSRASAKGCLDILELLFQHEPNAPNYTHTVAKAAAYGGHLIILKWVWTNHREVGSLDWLEAVNQARHIDVFRWLVQHNLSTPLTVSNIDVVTSLYSIGHPLDSVFPTSLLVAQFLHDHGVQFTTWHVHISIMSASSNSPSGQLEVIKFFHEYCPEVEFEPEHMDQAAKFGALDITQFLHKNRIEGCTTEAMDGAIRGGHFEIVKFLHENRHEGCSGRGLRNAIDSGDFEMVKYLVENYKDKQWDALIDNENLPYVSLEIFEYLLNNVKGFDDGHTFSLAVIYGGEDLLQRIAQRGNISASDIEAAIENAQRLELTDLVLFLSNLLPQQSLESNSDGEDNCTNQDESM
ncbi:unnamed protein product [Aphanomyces euteiches]|uniref:Uncharacterized protein n=1 Tax=Aphanomyces euteiches TaxID=100861 RepID=A0A6G0WQV5_9STRA|nr:hypothetical protein Ae201684_012679 [Aphanomyces euteiches]KAH9095615.1 hypothetical protein Ae201684P_015416 [Aphanomyces euteiches]KAH9143367.1 hypothetical protein AeRB84_012590 [Aphanomyces euteiches]